MKKYQAYASGVYSVTTTVAGSYAITDDITMGDGDFEWVEMEFSCYVGSVGASSTLLVEFMCGSDVLFTARATATTADYLNIKRAFSYSIMSAYSTPTVRIRVSANTGTINIYERQLNTKIYKR
jgi:hypothetical protein